jgi:O-antigen/teichoic acid export membrane protein
VRSNTTRLLIRNFSYLGIGQVASTALGILQSALVGRALDPTQFGILYTAFAILGFAYALADWGQGTYLVREMARGRFSEPDWFGSVIVFRLGAYALCTAVAVTIAFALGYNEQTVTLTFWTMVAWIPLTLYVPFSCWFRSKDRMDVDSLASIVGKATALVATALALRLGGGLFAIMLMQGVGNISTLLVGLVAASRAKIAVKAPAIEPFPELARHGAPIAALSLVIASQPFVEIALLSKLTGPAVVGWFGASRTFLGVIFSPAMLLASAALPHLSRSSDSLTDLRRTIDAAGRIIFIAAAFASSGLYLFADDMVAIIYGHGRFEQTASILRASALFLPFLFCGYLLTTAVMAVGRNKAMAVVSIARIAFCVGLSWFLIDYWQRQFGNGAIGLVIAVGLAEILALASCLMLLPKGAIGATTLLNLLRAYITSFCTVAPLSMLQPLWLLFLVPLFGLLFAMVAMATRLITPSDLRLALEMVRSKLFTPSAPKSASNGG